MKFGCSETYGQTEAPGENASLNRDPIRFTPVTDAAEIRRIQKLFSKSLTSFGPRYAVRQITFFADLTSSDSISQPGTGRFYAEVQPPAGASAIYAVSAGHPGEETAIEANTWGLFAATPDKSIPLVIFQTFGHYMGGNSGANLISRRLIDFRGGKPRFVVTLDCEDRIRGGACTAYDEGFEPQGTVKCSWISDRADFQCTQTKTSPWNWGNVSWKERYYLFSRDMMWPPEISETTPASLYDWAVALEHEHSEPKGKRIVLPYLADTVVLDRISDSTDKPVYLMASRGDSGHMWPRFHLVFPAYGAPFGGRTRELEIQTLETPSQRELSEANERIQATAPGILTGDPMEMAIKRLSSPNRDLHFFQVLLNQSKHHSLFWICVDLRRNPYRSQALLIATDASEYDHCRWAHILASAAAAQWLGKGDKLATLDVEPRRYPDFDDDEEYFDTEVDTHEKAKCPYIMDLAWSQELGWLMSQKSTACDQAKMIIRQVVISNQGDITARPAKMAGREQ